MSTHNLKQARVEVKQDKKIVLSRLIGKFLFFGLFCIEEQLQDLNESGTKNNNFYYY